MAGCFIPGLFFRVTQHRPNRRVEVEVRNQTRSGAFSDLACITDVIAMPMGQENKINMIEAGELLLAACERWSGYPWIDQQNLSRSRFDFESGVPIPG